MIRALVKTAGEDGFTEIDHARLSSVGAGDTVWVDVSGDDVERAREIAADQGLAVGRVDAGGIPSGIGESEDALVLAVPGFEIDESGGVEQDNYTMIVGARTLITIHRRTIPALDHQWEISAAPPPDEASVAELAAQLASAITRQIQPLNEELELRIDGLEELAFAADPRTLTEVHALRRDLITLRRIIGRQRDLMADIASISHPAMTASGQAAFKKAYDFDSRLVDFLDSARSMLQSALETYRGAVADQTNEIVRLLTVFSAILLPLGLIAGIFGMNFISIPAADREWGFWVTVGIMAILGLGLWLFFARRGFIGGPRLRELPRAVGLGIFHAGTAPVRAIASGVGSTIHHFDRRRSNQRDED